MDRLAALERAVEALTERVRALELTPNAQVGRKGVSRPYERAPAPLALTHVKPNGVPGEDAHAILARIQAKVYAAHAKEKESQNDMGNTEPPPTVQSETSS